METFSYQIAYHNIAIFLVAISYEIFDKSFKSKKYALLAPALICLVLAIGSYQSLFSFFPAIFALKLFIEYFDNNINIKEMIKRTLYVILFLIIALLCHYIIVKILGYSDSKYQSNWFSWAKYSAIENITNIFKQIYESTIGIKQFPTLHLVALISLFATWLHILRVKKQPLYKTTLEFLFLTILFIGSTHSVIIALGGTIILRTLSVLSIFFAGSIFIYYLLGSKIEKLLITAFAIFAVFYNGSVMTRQYMAGYYTMESDKTLATLILGRVYNVAPEFYTGQIPIAFIGSHNYGTRNPLRTQHDVMGGSLWQWDNGNPYRMMNFIRIVSGVPMEARIANHEEYQKALEYSKNMPAWPDKGSVELHDGVIIVKLSGGKN